MLLQVGVKAFLRNAEGKYLLVKRNSSTYQTKGSWDIVGGRIEPGTTLLENLQREVREETELRLISEPRLIFAQDIIPSAEKHIVRLTYVVEADGEVTLDTSENVEYTWLTLEEIKGHDDLDIYVQEIMNKNLL